MSNEEPTSGQQALTVVNKTYTEWQVDFPSEEPTVTIIFHGLLCFFFDHATKCEVGIHNTTHVFGNPHADQPHDYQVNIWQKDGGCPVVPESYLVKNPNLVVPLDIHVSGSSFPGGVAAGVYVYTGPDHDKFNRQDQDDPKDWRWIIDFEDKVYPEGIPSKRSHTLQPGVTIDNGLFYTLHKTQSKYALRPTGGGQDITLNGVAVVMAANIYLAPGGSVQLTGGPVVDRELKHKPGRTYQIDIFNLCDGGQNQKCNYHPASTVKEERNDFFLYYVTFDIPTGKPEYQLVRTAEGVEGSLSGVCQINPFKPRSSDDAPCGGTAFGQTPHS